MRRILFILLTVLPCHTIRAQGDSDSRPAGTFQFQSVPQSVPADSSSATDVAASSQSLAIQDFPAPRRVGDADEGSAIILDDKHKLLAGDRLTFKILEDRVFEDREPRNPNLPAQQAVILAVTDSGELNVPYIGLVTVSGKTCREAAGEIKRRLEKDYYYTATVVLGLDSATKVVGRFTIYGNVRNPGTYDLPVNETFTVGRAIARAGGFSDFADQKNVKVIRSVDGQTKSIEVNMVEVLEKGKIEKDIPILPDDYISVKQNWINL